MASTLSHAALAHAPGNLTPLRSVMILMITVFLVPQPATADLFTSVSCNGPLISGASSAFCSISGATSGTSSALATYGALRTDSFLTSTAPGDIPAFRANAEFLDTLTLGGFSGGGFIQYELVVDYKIATDIGSPFVCVNQTDCVAVPNHFPSSGESGEVVFRSQLYPVVSGTPFSLDVRLSTLLEVAPGGPTGQENYRAYLEGIFLYDSQLASIHDYTLTTASGEKVVVPEPGAIWLLAVAVSLALVPTELRKWRSRG